MTRVAHVINDLDRGGAETVLYRLLAGSTGDIDPIVVSLTSGGVVGDEIARLAVPVEHLGVSSTFGYARGAVRLRRKLARIRPQVVQTWMYHADIVGGIAAKTAGVDAIVWGIHATRRPKETSAPIYRAGLAIASALSKVVPDRIVCCSHRAARDHVRMGYPRHRIVVIPNGFEAREPDRPTRAQMRQKWGIAPDDVVIGCVARYHPDKDLDTFLDAARKVRADLPHVRFVLVGEGLDSTNEALVTAVTAAGLADRLSMPGPIERVDDAYSAMDVVVCSSMVEALPLALGEAMAMGLPVVTTDVGDAALMVQDAARVVPPGSADPLAQAIARVVSLSPEDRRRLGERDRETILRGYGLGPMVAAYEDLYRDLTGSR